MLSALSKSGKSDRVDEYVRKALEKKPKKASTWSKFAEALERLGLYEKALDVYEVGMETFNDEKPFFLGRGQVLTKLGKYEAAIVDIERAIEMYPKIITLSHSMGISLSHSMGISLHGLGKYEDAINAYDREIELLKWRLDTCDPKNSLFSKIMDYLKSNLVAVFCDKAHGLYILGLYEEAIEAYDEAININPNNAIIWYNRGVSLMKSGKLKSSLNSFFKALMKTLNPPTS
jgi:tetratricopeptide (TPR) repeat protein